MNTQVETVFEVTQDNFATDVIDASRTTPVLIDFWAPWCGPCKAISPLLDKLAGEYHGAFRLGKVNIDNEPALANAFGVRSIPTVVMVKDGRPQDGFTGAMPEGQIREFLTPYVQPAVAGADDGAALDDADDEAVPETPAQAIERLRQACNDSPSDNDLKLDLVAALLRGGQFDAADEAWQALPADATAGSRGKALQDSLDLAGKLADAPAIDALQQRIHANAQDWEARDLLGIRLLFGNDPAAGLEQFLYLLEHARDWGDGQARLHLLAAFAVIADPDLVGHYRRRMASLMF